MLRGSLSTHFLHDTGSLLIHSLLSRREDFEDPPTLKTWKDIRVLRTRRPKTVEVQDESTFIGRQRQSYSQGGVCWCTCVCTLSVFGLYVNDVHVSPVS
ncbi:hypothetical protein HanIR_Chr17g0856381 [Helianthus annuus]|nr:hypothetical protein HanIR_Chr17g0856381 [Helianthus annuus]